MTENVNLDQTNTEARLMEVVEQALELRHGAGEDPDGKLRPFDPNDGVQAAQHMLLRVVQRADRVDYLLAQATRARSRARIARDNAKFEAEYAYNTATNNNERNRTREFVSSAERHAAAALESLAEKRQAFLADRLVMHADEAYEVVNQCHRQLDAIRNDLRATLRSFQFESSLDR